jgi:phosphatidylserine/phosphatidylglycerophosphate/cardiolipin synthase-like enzyme
MTVPPLDALNAAGTPELLSREEKLVWILGDLMNAVENYFGAENPKRLGHINCAAIRIIDEVLTPAAARIEALEAALREIAGQMLIDEHDEDYNGDYEAGYEAIVRIARAALAPEQDK